MLRTSANPTRKNIDYLGCILITSAISFSQYGMHCGSITSWASPLVVAWLVGTGVGFAAFLDRGVARAYDPIIPLRQLCERTVGASQLSCFFFFPTTEVYSTILLYLPIYLQLGGSSSFDGGAHLIPSAIASGAGLITTGWIVKQIGR
jgi:hypothetical protein